MNSKSRYNSLVVAGPTASGKTALAVAAAASLNGEVISADSRQVYKGMDLGTGKDLAEYSFEQVQVPYHLIDLVEPSETFTLYNYLHSFYEAFAKISMKNRLPVVCGGTGLYIEAALKKYRVSAVPENPAFRAEKMALEKEQLIEELKEDPQIYELTDTSSKKRIVRALEIMHFGSADSFKPLQGSEIEIKPLIVLVMLEPELLKKRIELRLKSRLQEGMVEEVEALLDGGVSYDRMMMFGMEYKAITRYLRGEVSYEQMYEELKTEIFRLAKRQRTWFRGMQKRGLSVHLLAEPSQEKLLSLCREYLLDG